MVKFHPFFVSLASMIRIIQHGNEIFSKPNKLTHYIYIFGDIQEF